MSSSPSCRPRLRRSVDARLTGDGALYLLRGPGIGDIKLEGDAPLLARLLELCDGSREVSELESELAPRGMSGQDLERSLAALADAGIVDDAAEDALRLGPDAERFERQLACFADMLGSATEALEAQQRLANATVCLLGLGGLGSWAAWGLVSAGVGAIVGVDGDRVELSNLNRQILYRQTDVGELKTTAAGATLERFRRELHYRPVMARIDGVEAVRAAIRGSDFAIDSLDWPPHAVTRWVAEACFREGIPYLALSQHPPLVRIGPLYVPGETGCYACQESAYAREHELFEPLSHARQVRPPSATFGPACGVVGTIAANEAIAWLARLHRPACVGAAALIDLRTLDVTMEPVPREPECPLCGAEAPGRTA